MPRHEHVPGQILALDPGNFQTGWVVYDGKRVVHSGVDLNSDVTLLLSAWDGPMAYEMIACYGMPVGKEVFDTCVEIGRFIATWERNTLERAAPVFRKDVKLHLCGTTKAKDANVRRALIDLIGPQGVKANPGPTYGVKSHAWAALGVAVVAYPQLVSGHGS